MQRLKSGFCALTLLWSSAAIALADNSLVVGPNVHVSAAFPGLTQDEVLASADPTNPNNLMACVIAEYTATESKTIVYSSFDSGTHWAPTLLAAQGRYTGDPACAYGTGGLAYFATLGTRNDADGKGMGQTVVYSSHDAGRTWPRDIVLPSTDREYITVDNGKSTFAGRVYLNATKGTEPFDPPSPGESLDESVINGISIYHSIDDAATFAYGTTLTDLTDRYVLGMGNGAVLSDGTFVALFGDLKDTKTGWNFAPRVSTAWLKVVVSHDGGEHFDTATVIDDWYYCNISQDSDIPTLAVDSSEGPFRDRVYAAWPDIRSGRCQVMVAHSDDKGKTWSAGVVVNDDYPREDGSGPDDFMPVVAVNNRGVVGLMWYDRRDNSDNIGYWVRFAASYDGGETFTPSVRVSEAPSDLYYGTQLRLAAQSSGGGVVDPYYPATGRIAGNLSLPWLSGGHTAGLAATADGIFHPVWVDNRTGVHQVWTTAVTASGQAYKNGSPALAAYTDVTKSVYLDLRDSTFDRVTGNVTVTALLHNTSKQTIYGPIEARVLVLGSDFGVPSITNAESGGTSLGALWDFSGALEENKLPPGATSAPKQLTFHLTDLRSLRPPTPNDPDGLTANFVHFETAILARCAGARCS